MANPLSGLEAIQSIGKGIGIPETILVNQANIQPAEIQRVDFKELLNTAIESISNGQSAADASIAQLAAGGEVDLHNVMLAAEKASLTLQFAMQIKNKITDAYQSIMSMQI